MELLAAVRILDALAHETRLDVFRLLVRAGDDGLTPGAIASHLGIPSPTLSFHLKELRNAGIVRVRRQGRSLIYTAHFDTMYGLLGFLTDECCVGVTLEGACTPDPALEGATP